MTPHICTFSGKGVNPLDLQVSDICVEDIAHALALINRFNGHTNRPISVAQHSIYASRVAHAMGAEHWQVMQCFLHDGAEAYLGDVTKWLKMSPAMKEFRDAEARAQATVYRAFGLPEEDCSLVEEVDRLMVRWEAERAFTNFDFRGDPRYPAVNDEEKALIGAWGFWSWREAERLFLDTYRMLVADV